MKILYWNIRGIANLDSKLELSNICRSHKPDFLCISEPMVQFDVISAIFWSSLNMQLVAVNNKPNMPIGYFVLRIYLRHASSLLQFSR